MKMKPLVIIPARGGSKGVPNKNIKSLNGKPLIQYALEAASQVFDKGLIYISTDDKKIKAVVEQLGFPVPHLRPDELASDTSSTYDVIMHTLSLIENEGYFPDTIILLQPTSPFRNFKHISEAVNLYLESTVDMLVSVKEAKSNPYFVLFEEDDQGYLKKSKNGNYVRRQDCPPVWEYNGAIYIINVKAIKAYKSLNFNKVRKYVMDELSSVDIDTMLDWQIAEFLSEEGRSSSVYR
jgi:CMP-N,N'-diacetyllegionaminic acid synthase